VTDDSVFFWEREAPQAWHDDVAALAPKQDRSSHLLLWWESGTPEAPAQRWVIYQALPFQYVDPVVMEGFLSDHPCRCIRRNLLGERCPKCFGIESPGRYRIEQHLYSTGMFARPYWVIQGTNGGHRRLYSQVDQQAARLMGQPAEPPETGSLCYAPLDNRVLRKVRLNDLAQRAFFDLADAAQADKAKAQVAFRTALSDYVDAGVAKAFDDVPLQRRGFMTDELPLNHTRDRRRLDYEAERERFITQE
jgi:hypothetical protein